MKLRTQFVITMLLFGIILVAMAVSAIITNQNVKKASKQENVASSIAQGGSELSYLANDYLIYRESQQLKRWQSRFASFSAEVARLRPDRPEQQALVANIQANQNRFKEVFDSAASGMENQSPNQGAALDPVFLQVSWSRMAVQSQGLVSDASRLSQLLHERMDRLRETSTMLVYVMVGLFGAFLLVSYMVTYRHILKSIMALQSGAAAIGSGNLDFIIEEKTNDEIGELSHAFNRMTADLKTVTASKADLEKEITERKKAEEALRKAHDELEMRVQERTHELELINEDLKAENEERLKVEIELRESENYLRELSSELLNAQEKERRLVAQEIHDSIGSSLAATKFKVQGAITEVGENHPQIRAALGSILPMLQETIQETRRIQMNLRPPMLDDLGILATISWFCRQYESTYSAIRIRQEIDIKEEEVADSLKTVIFRVLQEGLNNSAKHSKASEVLLRLCKLERAIQLVIRDNGQGFDPSETHSRNGTPRGLGLVGMQERVELSGGSFAIESSIGTGTVIRASWPASPQYS